MIIGEVGKEKAKKENRTSQRGNQKCPRNAPNRREGFQRKCSTNAEDKQ